MRPPGDLVAHATNPLSKEWLHLPGAVALSLYVARKGRSHAALHVFVPTVASGAALGLSIAAACAAIYESAARAEADVAA